MASTLPKIPEDMVDEPPHGVWRIGVAKIAKLTDSNVWSCVFHVSVMAGSYALTGSLLASLVAFQLGRFSKSTSTTLLHSYAHSDPLTLSHMGRYVLAKAKSNVLKGVMVVGVMGSGLAQILNKKIKESKIDDYVEATYIKNHIISRHAILELGPYASYHEAFRLLHSIEKTPHSQKDLIEMGMMMSIYHLWQHYPFSAGLSGPVQFQGKKKGSFCDRLQGQIKSFLKTEDYKLGPFKDVKDQLREWSEALMASAEAHEINQHVGGLTGGTNKKELSDAESSSIMLIDNTLRAELKIKTASRARL